MNRELLLKTTLAVSFLSIMLGLIFKIMHYQYSWTIIMVGLLAAILYTIIALFEIWSSKQILTAEKLMWTSGFIVMSGLTGLLYLFIARKRILRVSPFYRPERS